MRYTILHILCEGQTEERFVKEVLSPYLRQFNIYPKAILLLTSKKKNTRGLYVELCTGQTRPYDMFDFYALPDDFPCFKKSSHYSDIRERISFIETEFAKDMGFDAFIPYIQLHEFESLLFVDITRLESDYITYWLIPPFKVLSSILLCLFVYPHQISVLCLEKKLVIRFTASILVPITTSA